MNFKTVKVVTKDWFERSGRGIFEELSRRANSRTKENFYKA